MTNELLIDLMIAAIDGRGNVPHISSEEFKKILEKNKLTPSVEFTAELINTGFFSITADGWLVDFAKAGLSDDYFQSLKRPSNYLSMDARRCWEVDKELGILDWSGSKMESLVAPKYWFHMHKPKGRKQ